MNLNKAQIIGRITQPLELKSLPNGNSVLNFSVATNYTYKNDKNQKIEQTEFHNVLSFGKQAETITKYFVKGQEIYVEGRLQTRSWEDKETKKKMYKTEILLNNFQFGSKPFGSENKIEKKEDKEDEEIENFEKDLTSEEEEELNPEDIPF